MTQVKRAKGKGVEYQAAANGPLWISADALEALGLDVERAEAALDDVRTVDGWLVRSNSAHHGELVKYAAAAWPEGEAVDRLNTALAVLQTAGRAHRVG